MTRSVPLFALLAAALTLSGCVGMLSKDDGHDHSQDVNTAARESAAAFNASMSAMANASANSTAASNASSNQTYDYSNCMVGMDMPGCPASVAEKRYQEQMAKAIPDRTLPAVKIVLDPQGNGQTGKTTFDEGTMQVLITVYLNHTGDGPYAALGPGGQGDLKLEMKSASASKIVTMSGTANTVGVEPATPLQKTYSSVFSMPAIGAWTLTVQGQGTNAEVTVAMVERFTM